MLTTSVKTFAVRFDDPYDAKSFIRAIRRRGWNARRQGQMVYVVIGDGLLLDLLVRQWAERVGRAPQYSIE